MMANVAFQDDNTNNWWFPETGGANVPALNELLTPWGISFASSVLDGSFRFQGETVPFASGVALETFPATGTVFSAALDDLVAKVKKTHWRLRSSAPKPAILGFYPNRADGPAAAPASVDSATAALLGANVDRLPDPFARRRGKIVAYGDSSCLDESHAVGPRCKRLLHTFVEYVTMAIERPSVLQQGALLDRPYPLDVKRPIRPTANRTSKSTLYVYSKVLATKTTKKPHPICAGVKWASGKPLTADGVEAMNRLPGAHAMAPLFDLAVEPTVGTRNQAPGGGGGGGGGGGPGGGTLPERATMSSYAVVGVFSAMLGVLIALCLLVRGRRGRGQPSRRRARPSSQSHAL
jgi:membrane-bound transcription factor site-1 protease